MYFPPPDLHLRKVDPIEMPPGIRNAHRLLGLVEEAGEQEIYILHSRQLMRSHVQIKAFTLTKGLIID